MANVKTRSIATNNLYQVKQSNLVAFAKSAGYETEAPSAAFNSANRLTVSHIIYEGVNDGVMCTLVPTHIEWTYQQDKATAADKAKLAKLEVTVAPLQALLDMGNITIEQFKEMSGALIDLSELEYLRDLCIPGASETKTAMAWLPSDFLAYEMADAVQAYCKTQK